MFEHRSPVRSQADQLLVRPFRGLARLAIRHPWRVLITAALVTLAAAPGVLRLKLRTDGHALVSPTAPEVVTDAAVRAHFGIHDQIVVLIRPVTNDLFNPATLQLVRDLTAEFKKFPGSARRMWSASRLNPVSGCGPPR